MGVYKCCKCDGSGILINRVRELSGSAKKLNKKQLLKCYCNCVVGQKLLFCQRLFEKTLKNGRGYGR